ncbi:GNAT family N-acetyltransferase [Methylobacterium sp. E-066]|uniref:GNAT family N-acetyltransferase n=1 Tax=Methylobacterium sp. E-066 TaxID=2836584 RepID=UPI001FBC00DB|nr:GNAT family N-acetyltransferase [Methylobacterium sp. E-066]MCJ2142772.1 GNAT family N-acetyltransferase [Methylobacterium sp. E-066]
MTSATQNYDLKGIRIERIPSRDCVRRFKCGETSIDKWVSDKAFKHHDQDRSRVFCALKGESTAALGFYALSFSPILPTYLFGQHADRYQDGDAPFVYIEWLAVQRSIQSNGIGTVLLINALQRAYSVSRNVAIYGVALRALNDRTRAYYEGHGFVAREDSAFPLMILPIWTLRDLFEPRRG